MSQKNIKMNRGTDKEIATLAGGCFWCLEAIFREVRGIEKVVSGYSGGTAVNPSYNEVCSGITGHAESVQLTYDPKQISFREILAIFFAVHDPTTLNRQGADVGTQYRSAIFYHNEEQKTAAQEAIKQLKASKVWDASVVTQVAPFKDFYPAEEYHQEYFARNPERLYCSVVIVPKLDKFRKQYLQKNKKSKVKNQDDR
ncbi:MAG: peptide-methionine (S)-S-oxide reductase MsrA [Dehalococcoidia bacterium]|nr:peptide-methionine (S)-S-oxide reductase MsrA [Dehalococcoidia bacterium]